MILSSELAIPTATSKKIFDKHIHSTAQIYCVVHLYPLD